MRVLMLTWEYPPHVVGGLARHVCGLSRGLAGRGHRVTVLTSDQCGSERSRVPGLEVRRLQRYPSPPGFLPSILHLNLNLMEQALRLTVEGQTFDIVHVHDWLVAFAGKGIAGALRLPLLATIHATEYGRSNGLHSEVQEYIHDVEQDLCHRAQMVICCSAYMREHLQQLFSLSPRKTRIVPNGIDPGQLQLPAGANLRSLRRQYACDQEAIVLFIGRLVPEKGVTYLLRAAQTVLSLYPHVRFIICGTGPQESELRDLARQLGIIARVNFTGFVDDKVRNALYQCSQIAVFPSLYEPFGIVALEAMAAGKPVIASNVGGFSEIIWHGINGLLVTPKCSDILAEYITALLLTPGLARRLARQAQATVYQEYSWDQIARRTESVYRALVGQGQESPEKCEVKI